MNRQPVKKALALKRGRTNVNKRAMSKAAHLESLAP